MIPQDVILRNLFHRSLIAREVILQEVVPGQVVYEVRKQESVLAEVVSGLLTFGH